MYDALHKSGVDYLIRFLTEPRDEDVIHYVIIAENLPCFAHSFAAVYALCHLHIKYVPHPDVHEWVLHNAPKCSELVGQPGYQAMMDDILTDHRVDLEKLRQYLRG